MMKKMGHVRGNAVGVINPDYATILNIRNISSVDIAGNHIDLGTMIVEAPHFDEKAERNAPLVLVRIDALFCNYRDKALIVKHGAKVKGKAGSNELVGWFGSDFVGTVLKAGSKVDRFSVGDRVISNCCYPFIHRTRILLQDAQRMMHRGAFLFFMLINYRGTR